MDIPRSAFGGRDRVALLLSEAKRRPEIAAYIDNILAYSEADIGGLPVPLPWYRLALIDVHRRARAARAMGLDGSPSAVSLTDFIVDGYTPDPEGTLYEYRGETRWYASIRVEYGAMFFVEDGGVLWLDTVSAPVDTEFLDQSANLGRTTRLGYKQARQEKLNRTHTNAPVVDRPDHDRTSSGARAQPLAHLGVTIQR